MKIRKTRDKNESQRGELKERKTELLVKNYTN